MVIKKIKECIFLLTMIFVFFNVCCSVEASLSEDELEDRNAAVVVFLENVDLSCDDIFTEKIVSADCLTIEKPFIVYHPDEASQDDVMYFPISDNGKILFLVEVISVDGRYICNMLDHLVDALNEINYANTETIVYLWDGCIYLETDETCLDTSVIYGLSDNASSAVLLCEASTENSFLQACFSEKKEQILERSNSLRGISETDLISDDVLTARMLGTLTLSSPQGQYGYGMCWASCVATVHNYLLSSVITGFEVCTRMSIGYNAGGSIYDEQDALALYGITYSYVRSSALTWSQLTTNINSSKPIIANGLSSAGTGHAVVIYGYSGSSTTTGNVIIWNPNLCSSGKMDYVGGEEKMTYSNSYFSDGEGTCFTWASSLSYY